MELYQAMGEQAGIRRLVDAFYDHMSADATFAALRAMHPADLADSRDHLHWFLVGWAGGPPMFVERRGHPRLRARHLPFAIGEVERDAWVACMRVAIAEQRYADGVAQSLSAAFLQMADHMRNQGTVA